MNLVMLFLFGYLLKKCVRVTSADHFGSYLVQKVRLPRIEELFNDIAGFIVKSQETSQANSEVPNPAKKRKLNASQSAAAGSSAEKIIFEPWKDGSWSIVPEISFSIPQRKKLSLEIGFLPEQGLRARNTTSDEIEFGVRWKDIRKSWHVKNPA